MSKLSPKHIIRSVYRRVNARAQDMLFADYARIRRIPQHLDIISLGSTPALFAIDYEGSGLKAFNLAVSPQTLEYDLRMLKNYHSFLDDHGDRLVLLVLCPFSLLKTRYTPRDGEVARDLRYYLILHHAMINGYDEAVYQRLRHKAPLYMLSSPARIRTALARRSAHRLTAASNPCDAEGMRSSARHYTTSWMQEFGLDSLDAAALPPSCTEAINTNKATLGAIRDFAAERGIKVAAVIPPLSDELRETIPTAFIDRCLLSPLKESGITILDFSADKSMAVKDNFLDALCLNAAGRRRFTAHLAETLKKHKLPGS